MKWEITDEQFATISFVNICVSDFATKRKPSPQSRAGGGSFPVMPLFPLQQHAPPAPAPADFRLLFSALDLVVVVCISMFAGLLTSVSRTPSLSSVLGLDSWGFELPADQVLARLARPSAWPELTLPFRACTRYSSTENLSRVAQGGQLGCRGGPGRGF